MGRVCALLHCGVLVRWKAELAYHKLRPLVRYCTYSPEYLARLVRTRAFRQ